MAALVAVAPAVLIPLYRLVRRSHPRGLTFLLSWIMGKRFWLVFGVLLHLGINLSINLGTFAEVMIAVYFAWLSGADVDAARRVFLRHWPQPSPPAFERRG